MAKTYTIIKTRGVKGYELQYTGTLDELVEEFSNILENGNSGDPKTAETLVKALNQSLEETQNGNHYPDSYRLDS